jgi:hypothetical protein
MNDSLNPACKNGEVFIDGCLMRSGSQPVRRKRMRLRSADNMARQQKEFRWIAVAMKMLSPL